MKRDAREGAETQRFSKWAAFVCYFCLLGYILGQTFLAFFALLYAGLKAMAYEGLYLLSRRAQRRRVLISTREAGNGC